MTATAGADYSSNGGGYWGGTQTSTFVPPYFANNDPPNDIHITSGSLTLTLTGKWNFRLTAGFWAINIALQVSPAIAPVARYNYGTSYYEVTAQLAYQPVGALSSRGVRGTGSGAGSGPGSGAGGGGGAGPGGWGRVRVRVRVRRVGQWG
jgi:hypothetical protein